MRTIALTLALLILAGCSPTAAPAAPAKTTAPTTKENDEAVSRFLALEAEIETETDPARLELLKTRLEELRVEYSEPEKILYDPKASIKEQIDSKLTPEEQVYREKLAVLMNTAIAAEDALAAAKAEGADEAEIELLKADLAEKTQAMADFQLGKTDD